MNRSSYSAQVGGSQKLLGLEVIRFLAALSVLLFHYPPHYSYVASTPFQLTSLPYFPYYDQLKFFYLHGSDGVPVFWAISGYIFFWKYRDAISEGQVTSRSFFILRFSRLYPLHFVTLIVVCALQFVYRSVRPSDFVYEFNDFYHFGLQLLMASNWGLERGWSFNGPIWSISLEILAYILFFCVLRRFGGSFTVTAAVVCMCAVLKIINLWIPVYYAIFDCVAFFYIGGFATYLDRATILKRHRSILRTVFKILLFTMPLVAWYYDFYSNKRLHFLFLYFWSPVLIYCSVISINVSGRLAKCLETVGNMTYASYLTHFPITLIVVLICLFTGITPPIYEVTFFAFHMTLVLAVSFLVFRYFEAPAQRWLRAKLL